MKKSTLLHLRIPFSFFLLPVFLFAGAVVQPESHWVLLLPFFVLHFLVYPASNGYNSYFDKDEESIGGLKRPPKVSVELYWVALILDSIALGLSFYISWEFALAIFIYGGVSKAYSHPSVRLKKYPIYGWLAAGVFQGYFTFMMCCLGFGLSLEELLHSTYQWPAFLSSLLLFGSYPMTQIYQHKEDTERGDRTLSVKLGILGTFHFTALFFTVATGGFLLYFIAYQSIVHLYLFLAVLGPVLIYFLRWYLEVRKDMKYADYERTMRLNGISALSFNIFFGAWWLFI